jgi:hypothetical protein
MRDAFRRWVDAPTLLDVLVGPRTRPQAALYVALPAVLWGVSLAGYATDAFVAAGGILIYPATAALLGVAVAFAVGVADRGLLLAAATAHGGALGYLSASAAQDGAGWSLAAQVGVLLRLDAHAILGVLSVVIALWPFVVGSVVGYAGRRVGDA